jgi:DNA-binding XRE family transcriptional regulator
MDKALTSTQMSNKLGISHKALYKMEREGKIKSIKTKGGHRRYKLNECPYMSIDLDSVFSRFVSAVPTGTNINELYDLIISVHDRQMKIVDIANDCNVTQTTVHNWVRLGKIQKINGHYLESSLPKREKSLIDLVKRFIIFIESADSLTIINLMSELEKALYSVTYLSHNVESC